MAAPVADTAPVVRPNPRRTWRRDAALLALGAIVLRLPALLASRHLTFDDGQYGTVVLGLRAGDLPFRDLFSSQGPLFYPLLWVADLVGLRTLDGPRLLNVFSGAGAAVATYAVGRRVASRSGALLAGVARGHGRIDPVCDRSPGGRRPRAGAGDRRGRAGTLGIERVRVAVAPLPSVSRWVPRCA